jgi:hypothetical protein
MRFHRLVRAQRRRLADVAQRTQVGIFDLARPLMRPGERQTHAFGLHELQRFIRREVAADRSSAGCATDTNCARGYCSLTNDKRKPPRPLLVYDDREAGL